MSWLASLGNLTVYCARDRKRGCDFVVALAWHCPGSAVKGATTLRLAEAYGNWVPTFNWRYVIPWPAASM